LFSSQNFPPFFSRHFLDSRDRQILWSTSTHHFPTYPHFIAMHWQMGLFKVNLMSNTHRNLRRMLKKKVRIFFSWSTKGRFFCSWYPTYFVL
jgi:hypothetical protein